MDKDARALVALGHSLRERGYAFTSITPASHARVNAREGNALARTLADVFGWSRPFASGEVVGRDVLEKMTKAGVVAEEEGGRFRSKVRFSTLGPLLLAHSAFPTLDEDAVFFGPDTYRFAALLRREIQSAERVVDVGCGTGAGGLVLLANGAVQGRLVLTDINDRALRFAEVNAELNGLSGPRLEVLHSDVLSAVSGPVDLVIANPPFLVDAGRRAYRHGGEKGIELSVRIAAEALERLTPGGRLVLYTATPVVAGRDLLQAALEPLLTHTATHKYEELDPDVFGEELSSPGYEDVDRLALVSFTATRR